MAPYDLSPSQPTLSKDDIARILASREGLRDVMASLAAREHLNPEQLLRVFVWLASSACEWTEGTFAVHLQPGGGPRSLRVDVVDEVGGGVCERLVPALEFRVDGDELRKLLGLMRPLLKGIVAAVPEHDVLVLRRQPERDKRDTDRVPSEEATRGSRVATKAFGVSDEFVGELSELAAEEADPKA